MSATPQFRADYNNRSRLARYWLLWSAPEPGERPQAAEAVLSIGEESRSLGVLWSPDETTWRENCELSLGEETLPKAKMHKLSFRWGEREQQVQIGGGTVAAAAVTPELTVALFELQLREDDPYTLETRIRVTGSGQRVRMDAGAGHVFWLTADAEKEHTVVVSYAKAGRYQVALDLVDEGGFRIGTLGEQLIDVAPLQSQDVNPTVDGVPAISGSRLFAPNRDVPPAPAPAEPWLPWRYARPLPRARCFRSPGSKTATRWLGAGVYVAIRAEVALEGGDIWYQTGGYDWVPAVSVEIVTPTALRGIVIKEPAPPPPPPPPPPPGQKRGIVTAQTLNVRSGAGVGYPIVGKARYGEVYELLEGKQVGQVTWFRIGVNRWISGAYVRLLPPLPPATVAQFEAGEPAALASPADPPGEPVVEPPLEPYVTMPPPFPFGWTVPPALVVRAAPDETSEKVTELPKYTVVPVLEEQKSGKTLWYRIGEAQWVQAVWVGVARLKPRPRTVKETDRWVAVSLKEQTCVVYEGDVPLYACLVSTGAGGTPTVQGVFRTWRRTASGRMAGPGYYLEEVTWTCYFYSGYALHTAYWHDAFGRPRSHGCVNFTPYDAWWIFQWSEAGGANSPVVYVYWA
jgi:lipoprotein-anchoring transpeptidase ErfK/SrfK